MTLGDLWHMEQSIMGAYEEVEHISNPDVQCKAFGMVMHWRELQVDLLKCVADNREVMVGDLAVMDSGVTLMEDEEILAKVAWANAEREMVELQA